MPVVIGKLRHPVEIQAATETTNEYGEVERTWPGTVIDGGNVWASITPITGNERFAGIQQVRPNVSHSIVIRFNGNVTPKHRIKYGNRWFEIDAVLNRDERDELLELLCKEAV
jgi:SPP1 family predicted phage head-tail adaptor